MLMVFREIHTKIVQRSKSIYLFAAACLVIVFLILVISNSFLCDDAFITFRFSKNLANGFGPVYNIGERVEGYTNFLWMILMALVAKLGGSPLLWSRLLAACFSSATLILFLYCVHRDSYRNKFIGFIFVLFLAFSSPFIVWSSGGLETAAFSFFIFAAILSFTESIKGNNGRVLILSSILFSLSSLTRPEGVLAFCLALGFLLAALVLAKTSPAQVLKFVWPFIVLYGVYFIWRFSYYGKMFPNTFYIKEPSSLLLPLGIQYYKRFLIGCPIWIPLIPALIAGIRARLRGLLLGDYFIAAFFLVYSCYVIYIGGDFMDLWRFIMPLLAPFFLALYHLGSYLADNRLSRYKAVAFTTAFVVFAAANINSINNSLAISYDYNVDSIGALRNYVKQWSSVGKLIREIGNPSDTIAVTAAGIIPYYTDMYTIDMYGLEAADLSKYGHLEHFTRPGHRMTISLKYLYDNKPHYMIAHPLITEGQPRYFPYSQAQDLYPVLLKEYSAVSIALPDIPGYYFNFRVRNDIVGKINREKKIYKVDYWSEY
jgi:hypothetical protein